MFKNIFAERATLNEKAQEQEGNAFTKALNAAREKGDDTFVVAGKKYKVEDYHNKKKMKDEDASNDKSDDGEGMDKVDPKALKKKFADRKDKDVDNDGDVDDSDKYLVKRRQAIAKSDKEDEPKKDNGEEEVIMNPKKDKEKKETKEEADPDTVRMMKANPKMQKTGGPGGMKGLNKKAQEQEGNAFTKALNAAREKGDDTFVVAGKKYKVEDYHNKKKMKDEDASNDKSDDGEGMDKVDPKALKKKFADRKDKDVDNDGDVDDSDKYLVKRRQAIAKSDKEDEPKKDNGEEEVIMNPKKDKEKKETKEEADPDTVRMMKANPKMQKTGGPGGMKGLNKKAQKDTKAALKKEETSIRDRLMSIWEDAAGAKRKKDQNRDEGGDANSGSAKQVKDGHGTPETVDDTGKSHDDAAKAGKTGPGAKPRSGGDNTRSGDQKILNKVKEAYASMYKEESND